MATHLADKFETFGFGISALGKVNIMIEDGSWTSKSYVFFIFGNRCSVTAARTGSTRRTPGSAPSSTSGSTSTPAPFTSPFPRAT